MMKSNSPEDNKSAINQKLINLAEAIYFYLNQGNLFEIYQIVDQIKSNEEKMILEKTFLEKYHFDFRQHI